MMLLFLQAEMVEPVSGLAKAVDHYGVGPVSGAVGLALIYGFVKLVMYLVGRKANAEIDRQNAESQKQIDHQKAEDQKESAATNALIQTTNTLLTKFVGDGNGNKGKLTEVADKVDQIDEKVTHLGERVDGLSGRMDELNGRVDVLSERVDELATNVSDLSGNVTSLRLKMNETAEETLKWRNRVIKAVLGITQMEEARSREIVEALEHVDPCKGAEEMGVACAGKMIMGIVHDTLRKKSQDAEALSKAIDGLTGT
jgi:methyl-accepting chemotaxis protein